MLWLNFAFIEHQYDLSRSHHSHHNCEQFASVLHGASPSLNAPTLPLVGIDHDPLKIYHFNSVFSFAYLARSPPIS
ncbi:DUF2607 family protein [Vibrio sp. TBV020]|uniref:DUF2607 family protein n=1 Tax=Vibrio sp. TBV020 TaxID=3137398 RepID=UPI0038CD7880